jgi:NAD(P)H-flavin reductase
MTAERDIPQLAEVVTRIEETPTIFSLSLRLVDEQQQRAYRFQPGQFNMLYLFGAGEVPISIASDPHRPELLHHTIRNVGRVTRGLERLQPGDRLGLRGPFGRGWPLDAARGHDVLIITGGLGCAPVLPVISQLMQNRDDYGRVAILQGVKHSSDMIWRERYATWAALPDTQVLLAADVAGAHWSGTVGRVTTLLEQLELDPGGALTMMCGPEPMMLASARELLQRGAPADSIWLSMERNMQCAIGHCGHCQFGEIFICKDGPVFPFPEVQHLFGIRGI